MQVELKNTTLLLRGDCLLDGVSLLVQAGQKVVLTGPSGIGKSSLIKMLLGIIAPQKGEALIDEVSMTALDAFRVRQKLYYMPQDVRPTGDETVRDFVLLPFQFKSNQRSKPHFDEIKVLFDKLKLKANLIDAEFRTLSGGERQRVGIARGLLLDRPLMLLDESTAAIDEANKKVAAGLLFLKAERTVIAVTHDPYLVERADRRLVFDGGQIKEG